MVKITLILSGNIMTSATALFFRPSKRMLPPNIALACVQRLGNRTFS